MNKPRQIVVFGEALIDLFPPAPGVAMVATNTLLPRLGGAPANVAVHLGRRQQPVALVSAVGDGPLGRRVLSKLEAEGVDVDSVVVKKGLRTGITLVELSADGERSFTAHRANAADLALVPADLDEERLAKATLVHGGTVTLSTEKARAATAAVRRQSAGALQTLDVNLRFGMFPDKAELLRLARQAIETVNVVKLALEEAQVLFPDVSPENDIEALADAVLARGPTLVLLTLDAGGALLATARHRVRVQSPTVDVVDATGAGDAFMGAALAGLPHSAAACAALTSEELGAIGTAACQAGALACTTIGACGDV